MAFIDKTIEVAADVRDVYEVWTSFEDFPTFMETIETVTCLEGRPPALGRGGGGRHLRVGRRPRGHVDDEKVVWQAIDGRETGEVRFEKLAAGRTKVTYQLKYDPDSLGRARGHAGAVDEQPRRRGPAGLQARLRSGRLTAPAPEARAPPGGRRSGRLRAPSLRATW